jgi:outer membrane protein assembly factor BamB/tetratricopeptide (TPR) repeat protein
MMRLSPVLALLLALPPRGQNGVQEDRVYVEELKRDILDRFEQCVQDKDWRRLFEHYDATLQRHGNSVVPVEENRWTSVREHLRVRFSQLPPEALQAYRFEKDGPARAAFEKARESGDDRRLEQALETYFFAGGAAEMADGLAQRAFDGGRPAEAAVHWTRLLYGLGEADRPGALVAARLALALRAIRNEAALAELKAWVEKAGLRGKVLQGGRERTLAELLAEPLPPAEERRPEPAVQGLGNEIRRWSYDFSAEKPAPVAPAPAAFPGGRVIPNFARSQTLTGADFPNSAGSARIGEKIYVLASDGTRVVAFDPAQVKGESPTAGVYWKYPLEGPLSRQDPSGMMGRGQQVPLPTVGVLVDGDLAFVPLLSRLEVRSREGIAPQDVFEGPTSIKCFHIPTGRVVWDSDASANLQALGPAGAKYVERNFAYTGTPWSDGHRLFVPVCTSPVGEQESWVLCLDRATGRPLWATFLASVMGVQMGWARTRSALHETRLAERDGLLFAQTNLGVTAALNPSTGTLQWLSRYRRTGRRVMNMGVQEPVFHRDPVPPIVWNGRLYVLPQDRPELLIYEAATGRPVELPRLRTMAGEFDWRGANYLLGPVQESLLVAGSPSSCVIRLRTMNAYGLIASNTRGMGRGLLQGDRLLLPTGSVDKGPGGSLVVFDVRTWKLVSETSWRESGEAGNLLAAGEYLVASGRKLGVYSSLDRTRADYAARLDPRASPSPALLIEYGDLMRVNGRLEEAAEAYQRFIASAAGDASHDARIRQVRTELYAIFLEKGQASLAKGDAAGAAEAFGFARSFAWDDRGELEAVKEWARALESLGRRAEAAEACQELLEREAPVFTRSGELVIRASEWAMAKLAELRKAHPEAVAPLEARAAARLAAAADEAALRDVLRWHPGSAAAREAHRRLGERLKERGAWAALLLHGRDFAERFGEEPGRELLETAVEAADRAGDRLAFEEGLEALERRFGEERIGPPGQERPLAELLRERRAARAWPATPAEAAPGPLKRTATLRSDGGLPLLLLSGEGSVAAFGAGSSVELWDADAGKRKGVLRRPGAWLGATVVEGEAGLRVSGVAPAGPAEAAGMRLGDLLSGSEGRPLTLAGLDDLLLDSPPGRKIRLSVIRDRAELAADVTLEACPDDAGPRPLAAAALGDGWAVAWPDVAAWYPADGAAPGWTFRPGRARFEISWMQRVDDTLYVWEAVPARQGSRSEWTPEDANHRLHALAASSGRPRWSRAVDFDPAQPDLEVSISFEGRTPDDAGFFLHRRARQRGAAECALWRVLKDGRIDRKALTGNVMTRLWDPRTGIWHYVGDVTERRERSLHGVAPGKNGKDYTFPLNAEQRMPPSVSTALLARAGAGVALLMPPGQVNGEARARHLAPPWQQDLALVFPEGRTLPANWPGGIAEGREGEVLVYNQLKEAQRPRGFLTAFRPEGPGKGASVWESPAPELAGSAFASGFRLERINARHVLLSMDQSRIEGLQDGGAAAVVYDLDEDGRVVLLRAVLRADGDRAQASGGRLFLPAPEGLEVYR